MNRILHVVGRMNRAGAETMIMNIYRNIDREKVQFDFLYFTEEKTAFDNEIEKLGGKIYRLKNSNGISNIFRLKKLLKKHPEINGIHCHTLLSSSFYLLSAYTANLTLRIIHSHNTKSRSESNIVYNIYEKLAKIAINRYATHFLSCGNLASKYLYPYKKESEITMIPNAIEVEKFYNASQFQGDYLRKLYSISRESIILLQVGRFLPVKNHSFSVDLAKQLLLHKIPFKMFFAGTGELEQEIEKKTIKEGLEKNIIFLGDRTDIEYLMAGADIMLMPSLFEGFPLVLVEAQSAGLHSIVSENVSKEVDLEVGLLSFEKLNIPDWLVNIQNYKDLKKLNNGERLEKIKNKGFDIMKSIEKILKIYES